MKRNVRIEIAGVVLIVLMMAAGVLIERKMKLENPVFLTGETMPEKTVLLVRDETPGSSTIVYSFACITNRDDNSLMPYTVHLEGEGILARGVVEVVSQKEFGPYLYSFCQIQLNSHDEIQGGTQIEKGKLWIQMDQEARPFAVDGFKYAYYDEAGDIVRKDVWEPVCLDVKSCVTGRRRAAGSDAWHPDPRLQRDQKCSGRIKNRDTFE